MVYSATRRGQARTSNLNIGVSALALMCIAGPALAQTAAEPVAAPRPAGDGPGGTFSGTAGAEDGTAPTTQGSASTTTGTSGASQDVIDTPPDNERDEIVVTGVRQSLANAQNIKRNSDTVVDAITAEDIGALPDRSVNEALQRVPGIAISRFAAPNDSQHYSAQGSGVVIRGLSYVRGEFNGRDAFAAGGGREIGFNDIPSEIVGSIEVFKNLTADLVEGGISGTVNINTRKPFDSNEDLLFLSGGVNYGDLEERASPSGVGLFSKQFETGGGSRFGILGSVTYSQVFSRSDSVFTSSFLPRRNDDRNGNGVQDAGEGRVINAGTPFAATLFDSFPLPAGFDRVYVPLGGGSRTQNFDRERLGFSGAAQFENADRSLLVTAQFVRAESKDEWIERTVEPNVYYGDVTTVFPVGPNPFTYDDDGIFTSGTLGKRTGLVLGNNPRGFDLNGDGVLDRNTNPDGTDAGLVTYGPLTQFAPDGIFTTQSNRHFYSKSITQDQSLNIKWRPTDRLKLNFDGQYVTSDVKVNDDILDTATFSQTSIDLRGGGAPVIQSLTPGFDTAAYFANPNSVYFRDAFNGIQLNEGTEYALRADAQYDISEDGFLRNVRVGARYANREQLVRSADYNNWGNLSETWAAAGPISYAQSGGAALYSFDNFFRGKAVTPPSVSVVAENILRDREAFLDLLRSVTAQGGGSYRPFEDRVQANGQPLIEGTFLPSELFRNTEETIGAYARVDFGIDDFGNGMGISGNIGLRYVNTKDTSDGAITFPQSVNIFDPSQINTTSPITGIPYTQNLAGFCLRARETDQLAPVPTGVFPAICTITPAQQQAVLAFSNGTSVPEVAEQQYDHFLPSLNVKLQVTPELLFRFAGSKAISRPNFGDLRNFVGIGPSGGNAAGNFNFSAGSRNPFLRPVEATQFDLTAEWYFAKVGSLTAAAFYKDLSNIIVDNFGYTRDFTNNGQTYTVAINGPANVEGSAKIKGFELGYQQTYDFLPGLMRGLGLQANYTFVEAGNIPNPVPANAANDGNRPPQDVAGLYDNLPVQGLSKHTVNVAGFYDLGAIYARVAYSWRSKFLLTNRDCCFPFLPVYALPTGQLDASIFVTVNKNFKLGLTGSNLLDETTKTAFLLNGDGLEAPRSFFKNDRTFSLTARLTY